MQLIKNLIKIYAAILLCCAIAGAITGGAKAVKELRAENNKPLFNHSPEFLKILNHYEKKEKVAS
jgi:hypothetical protein